MSMDREPPLQRRLRRPELKLPAWRRMATYGAVALAAMGFGIDSKYTVESRQQLANTEIMAIDNHETDSQYQTAAWIMLPGFKMSWQDSQHIAESLSPTLSERGRVYAAGYSNEGVDMEELYQEIVETAKRNNIDTIHFYGHSIGSLKAFELAGMIHQRRDDLTVATIVSDSGPTGGDQSIFDKDWLRGMATGDDINLHVPTTARLVLEASQRLANRDERSFSQVAEQTFAEIKPTAVSTKRMMSMADYLMDYDRQKFNQISPETNVFLISNIDDAMVDQHYVRRDLRQLLGDQLDMIFAMDDDVWPAHASPQYNPEEYCQILDLIQKSYMPDKNDKPIQLTRQRE